MMVVYSTHRYLPLSIQLENVLLGKDKGQFKLTDFGSATTKTLTPGAPGSSVAEVEEDIQKFTTLTVR